MVRYAELERAINRMATRAGRLGLRPGDIVGLATDTPRDLSLTLALALARIGVATAEPHAPTHHLRLRFDGSAGPQPDAVGFDPDWAAPLATSGEEPVVPLHPDPDALCQVFASTGRTGKPRHVPVSHALLLRRVMRRWQSLSGEPDVRIIAVGPGCALGFETVLSTLWAGGTLVFTTPGSAAAAIRRHAVTAIATSPAALRGLLDAMPPEAGDFPTLAIVEVSGSLPPPLGAEAARRLCPHILSEYGSAEAGCVAAAPVTLLAERAGARGLLLDGVAVQAMDMSGAPMPPGYPGRLRIRGDGVAPGYLWEEDGAPAAFHDGWFCPGTLGAISPDGMLACADPAAAMSDDGAIRLSPQVIEAALLRLPTVLEAAAFALPDEAGTPQVGAAIVARGRIDDAVLNAFCARALPGITLRVVLQMRALPRNESGQVLRAQLTTMALRLRAQRTGT